MQDSSHTAQAADGRRSLSDLRTSEGAAIVELQGGYGFRSRLAALGFTPGAEVKMLRNLSHGPVIVTIRETRIALGRQEADRILVTLRHNNDSTDN